jgi:3',5'-cyclic-AMP phosphodiesterase
MKRRNFIEHVGWTGAGIAWTLGTSGLFTANAAADEQSSATMFFVQISDSHIGFNGAANTDVRGTLSQAVAAINALPKPPLFVIHTGDVTHLSKSTQFDDAKQILGALKAPLLTIPGEHDVLGNSLDAFRSAFPNDRSSTPWYSWDHGGVHFVALVNVFNFETMGLLGQDQLDWLRRDLQPVPAQTPVVVFGHVPLYALYPEWGWTTQDGAAALSMLGRFEHVTVLNGHIHQVITHEEGTIRFATAAATAYPQPKPGTAPKPGPVTLPPGQLLHAIGYRTVEVDDRTTTLDDRPLG